MVRRVCICSTCNIRRFIASSHREKQCDACLNSRIDDPKPLESDATASKKRHFVDNEEDEDEPLTNLLCKSSPSTQGSPLKPDVKIQDSCIDLMSDEDVDGSEGDEGDDTILGDLDSVSSSSPAPPSSMKQFAVDFRRNQDALHQQTSVAKEPTTAIRSKGAAENLDLSMCFICGASLSHIKSGYKGRLNHIKRCSKTKGVSAKDVRIDDDEEDFTPTAESLQSHVPPPPSAGSGIRNPYARKNTWHGSSSTPSVVQDGAKKPTSFDLLMAGARRVSKTEKIKQQRKKTRGGGGYNTFRKYNSSSCPSYKKIPGTDFVCDGFQYAGPETKNYFLTHFHSDHYGGITKDWRAGLIYCSLPTANLVHEQLGVPRDFLHPLSDHEPHIIESCGKPITVTLLDANHCPGSIMFLFEVGKRAILHVGDFRWNLDRMSSQAPLKPFCRTPWTQGSSQRRIDDLFLDTTYCDAKYALPSQADCIKAVVEVASEEIRNAQVNKHRILMLFGAYTIGKEAVYMAVAKHLGEKVYVDKRRYRILSALQWPEKQMAMLTTNPQESMLWVVPLGHVNMKKMPPYQSIRRRGFARDFDRVVGFRPTGWSVRPPTKKKNPSIIGTTKSGSLSVHSVPYSEHSSFPELLECLETLNPCRIIPTVQSSTSQQQVELLTTYWRDKQAKLL